MIRLRNIKKGVIKMDFRDVVNDILKTGMTQSEIASLCNTSRQHIHAIVKSDKPVDVQYNFGVKLLNLRKTVKKD